MRFTHGTFKSCVCKNAVYGLQPNKTPETTLRIGKSLGALMDILEKCNELFDIKALSRAHHRPGIIKERNMIIKVLQEAAVLRQSGSRQHQKLRCYCIRLIAEPDKIDN